MAGSRRNWICSRWRILRWEFVVSSTSGGSHLVRGSPRIAGFLSPLASVAYAQLRTLAGFTVNGISPSKPPPTLGFRRGGTPDDPNRLQGSELRVCHARKSNEEGTFIIAGSQPRVAHPIMLCGRSEYTGEGISVSIGAVFAIVEWQ